MYEILLSGILLLVLAAKRTPKRRRRYNLRRVRISPGLALSTLAVGTVVKVGLTGASTIAYRAISLSGRWSLDDLTAGEGPIVVGYAHSDYTIGEIKECIESANSISPGLKIEQERSNRLVRSVGILGPEANSVLNNGLPVKTRLNWKIPASSSGNEVVMFAYNDGSALLTTGAFLRMNGNMWVQDSI